MSGPWEQFQQGRVVENGPWTQFAGGTGTKPLEITVTPQKRDFGIDFSQPIEVVRQQVAALPEADRKPALDAWAEHFVANENRTLKGLENVVGAVARGTPVGSWLDETAAGINQAAHSISNGMVGAPYDEAVAYHRARAKQFDKENPKTSIGLQLGGAVATAPFAPGIRAVQGVSMLGKMANAGLTGMAYGTAYGAGLGESAAGRAEEAAKGAALGTGLGAVSAPIASGLSNTAKYVMDIYRGIPGPLQGTSRAAIEKVARAMDADGLYSANGGPVGVGSYQQKVATLGREGMLADMGDNLLMQVQGITTQPGKGQSILKDAINDRAKGASGRIKADTDAVLGPAQNMVQQVDDAVFQSKILAKPHYDAFYNATIKPTDALIEAVQRVPQAAWQRARQLAEMEGIDLANVANTGRGIDLIKRAVDDIARDAGPGTNLERITSNLSRTIRDETDRILSPNDPSKSPWAIARQYAMDGFRFKEGAEEGAKAFSRGTHPDQMAADLARMSSAERGAYNAGARGQIRDIMGNAATSNGENGAAAARRALGSEFARDKLAMVTSGNAQPPPGMAARSGPDRLIARLDAESTFANTKNTAWQGTQTAARTAAQKEFPSAASKNEFADKLGGKSISGVGMEALYRMGNAVLGGALDARNAKIAVDAARMLAAQGATRDQIAQSLMQYGRGRAMSAQQRDGLEKFVTKIIGSTRGPAISRASE